jgi:hypothetical protein
MSDKSTTKAKADLLAMLAQAVLNTPGATPIPIGDVRPAPELKTRPAKKRLAKIKKARASSSRKPRPR